MTRDVSVGMMLTTITRIKTNVVANNSNEAVFAGPQLISAEASNTTQYKAHR